MKRILITLLLTTVTVGLAIYALPAIHGQRHSLGLSPQPNVVLVTIDTLRADHLGCYGYPRSTSPFLDELAGRGVLFEHAMSSSSATTPSLASLFTSLEVDQHGVYNNFFDHFPDHYSSLYTMAHMFSDHGYTTVAMPAVNFLVYIDDGFSTFLPPNRPAGRRPGRAPDDPASRYHYAPADVQYEAVTNLPASIGDGPFFLWLHFYDVHEDDTHHRAHDTEVDYEQLFDISSGKGRQGQIDALRTTGSKIPARKDQLETVNVYDEKIYFVDRYLRRIHDYLEETGLNDDTLWIITSDHGEGLWQHKIHGHAEELYNDQLHVPLIFYAKYMSGRGTRIEQLVRTVDVLPTLAEVAGASLEKQAMEVQGKSLVPLLNGNDTPITDYAYSRLPMYHRNWVKRGIAKGKGYAIQNREYKYIFFTDQGDQFYDLGKDPHESRNIIDTDLPIKDKLESDLQARYGRYHSEYQKHLKTDEHIEIDDSLREELKALGYVD